MGKFEGLILDIDIEKQNLERLVSELEKLKKSLKGEPSSTEIRAAGSILHDFYTGLEKIFERIAIIIDGGLPQGEDWHIQLMRRMFADMPNRRPAVFDESLKEILGEYLSFRHLFRNIYGFDLKWERCKHLFDRLPSTFQKIDKQLGSFIKFLSEL